MEKTAMLVSHPPEEACMPATNIRDFERTKVSSEKAARRFAICLLPYECQLTQPRTSAPVKDGREGGRCARWSWIKSRTPRQGAVQRFWTPRVLESR